MKFPVLQSLSPNTKKATLIVVDLLAYTVALWSAFALRFSDWWPLFNLKIALPLFALVPVISVVTMWRLGLYRTVVRYMDIRKLRSIAFGTILLVCVIYSLIILIPITNIPRSVPLIFGLCACLYVGGSRVLIREIVTRLIGNANATERIIIFGAGAAGVQLVQLCNAGTSYASVAFVDEDKTLWGREVSGLPVYPPHQLSQLVNAHNVGTITLAMPSASEQTRLRVINMLSDVAVDVKTMPTLSEIVAGEPINNIREVAIEELLGRTAVEPVPGLLHQSIRDKNVCITGAGGSIGAELARQALAFGAAKVMLYEQSEFALYNIGHELNETAQKTGSDARIIPLLGSILDRERLCDALSAFEIHTMYHAAAYKHVPIVEHNITQGVINNVIGSETAALAAEKAGVERFILVSTDKAVRPTNVMGASKRLAELVLQDLASKPKSNIIYSMVRFGNVLDSSGSVVPVFRKQIKDGQRITVTHPDVTRYFMTISEAAMLVIQAGSLANGGEVFVLDMGKPIKILDLARTMVRLSGRTIRSDECPDGDIEIEFTGLRPGEKLYEELLVGSDAEGTSHPKILCALEEKLSSTELRKVMKELRNAVSKSDPRQIRQILAHAITGYDASTEDVDWLIDVPRGNPSEVISISAGHNKDHKIL